MQDESKVAQCYKLCSLNHSHSKMFVIFLTGKAAGYFVSCKNKNK